MCQARLVVNWENDSDVTIFHHDVIVNFFCRCLVTGPEILKSEILPSEFCPISGDWDE